MIEHVWSVLCTRSLIDRETNNISLIDVVEQMTINAPPPPEGAEGLAPLQFELVSLWSRRHDDKPVQGRARIRFFRPSGPVGAVTEISVDLMTFRRTRARSRISGLPIREAGRHSFEVDVWDEEHKEWRGVARIPIEVAFGPPAAE